MPRPSTRRLWRPSGGAIPTPRAARGNRRAWRKRSAANWPPWHGRCATGRAGCLISGGEPVVRLVEPSRRGMGGRNQQLALAAVEAFWEDGACDVAFLSGGTDGEDGPTDAAGAFFDARILQAARDRGLSPQEFLARNDAYNFFAPLDALLKTGPTHTNVCDLRVVCTDQPEA